MTVAKKSCTYDNVVYFKEKGFSSSNTSSHIGRYWVRWVATVNTYVQDSILFY